MLLYCRNGIVVATYDDDQNVDPSAYSADVIVVPVPSLAGLTRVGDAPAAGLPDLRPYAQPATTQTVLLAYAASARYLLETRGIAILGKPVSTNRGSQAQIAGALLTVQANPSAMIQWKYADDTWASLPAAAIIALATAVSTHVQTCFAAEATLAAGIKASPATVTTLAQIDAALAAIIA